MFYLLTCHLQLRMKKKAVCPVLIHKLLVKIKKLHLSTVNQLYTLYKPEFIHFFRAFHDSLISLALFTHLSIDASI